MRSDPPIAGFRIPSVQDLAGMGANTFAQCGLPEPGWAHRHTFYMIVYITKGSGAHVIDCQRYELRPGAMYFLRPHQVHLWEYESLPAGYALSVSEDVLGAAPQRDGIPHDAELFNDLADVGQLWLSPEAALTIHPVIEEIEREYRAAASSYSSVMHSYLHVLLVRAHRVLQEQGPGHHPSPAPPLVRRFTDLVTRSGGRKQRVRDYSDVLGITPSHLAEAVREVTGRTPGQIIRDAQIAEARRLLRHTDKTIGEIAYGLGFRDSAYFGRFFKREAGVSPGAFRREARSHDAAAVRPTRLEAGRNGWARD
jgi:AraC family transcriptional regulator, transcriptional activator of pobA